jgi:hypothetical protein
MASAREAMGMLTAPGVGVARVGRSGDWSFAVEYGDAAGCTTAGLQAASRDGADAVNFLLTPWHPPSLFSSYKDGVHLCSFGIGEESRRYGSEPDLLVPAWEQVGVLPGGPQSGLRGRRLSMLVIGEHFGLRLPRQDIVEGSLPLFRVRGR